jgi:hypothetical protein
LKNNQSEGDFGGARRRLLNRCNFDFSPDSAQYGADFFAGAGIFLVRKLLGVGNGGKAAVDLGGFSPSP